MIASTAVLSGWGRTPASSARLVDLSADELTPATIARLRAPRGIIARGLGRSYGDAAQNGGGTVARLRPGPILLDPAAGTVTVGAGVSLDELLRHLVPRGFFVPVTPGTRFVTVGGAVASDIHGKNHHVDGTFGAHVEAMTIVAADGRTERITPDSHPDWWWATIGGMGLTGMILDATVRLLPIETSRCLVDTERVPDLDTLMATMETDDHRHRYSVAWVDLVATGRSLGRSVLTQGDHASVADLAECRPGDVDDPLVFDPSTRVPVPSGVPNVLTRTTVRAFNELWYRKAPRAHRGLETITSFFHPLDMVLDWNRLYGPAGFLQYQFVVPFEAADTVRDIVGTVATSGHASFLAVLKRMGPPNAGMLSFPTDGWTLTLDLPAGVPRLGDLLTDLDRRVIAAGGRHYLAKDASAPPEVIRAGYPRLDEWRAVRRRVDPDGVWLSDQARRLDLA